MEPRNQLHGFFDWWGPPGGTALPSWGPVYQPHEHPDVIETLYFGTATSQFEWIRYNGIPENWPVHTKRVAASVQAERAAKEWGGQPLIFEIRAPIAWLMPSVDAMRKHTSRPPKSEQELIDQVMALPVSRALSVSGEAIITVRVPPQNIVTHWVDESWKPDRTGLSPFYDFSQRLGSKEDLHRLYPRLKHDYHEALRTEKGFEVYLGVGTQDLAYLRAHGVPGKFLRVFADDYMAREQGDIYAEEYGDDAVVLVLLIPGSWLEPDEEAVADWMDYIMSGDAEVPKEDQEDPDAAWARMVERAGPGLASLDVASVAILNRDLPSDAIVRVE